MSARARSVLDGCRTRAEALERADLFVAEVYADTYRQFMTDLLTADAEGELYAVEDLDEVLDFYREHHAILEADARILLRRLVCDRCDAAGVT